MTGSELIMFNTYINDIKHYYEFGVGGSTVYVYNNTDATIEGVDSSRTWITKVASLCPDTTRINLHHVNIGTTGAWGFPNGEERRNNWPDYSNSINSVVKEPELVLVDGRFRVACIANTILYALNNNVELIIMLHDAQRSYYNPAKDLLQLIDSNRHLHAYKLSCRDKHEVTHVLNNYMYTAN